jgi:hypothetical protein
VLPKKKKKKKKQSKPEPNPLCVFHGPAFLGDNSTPVGVDLPKSFHQQQTANGSQQEVTHSVLAALLC